MMFMSFIMMSQEKTAIPIKNILILHGDAQFSSAQKIMDHTFDEVFSNAKIFLPLIYSEDLEAVRFDTAEQIAAISGLLEKRYAGMKFDLIMATDVYALRFMLSRGNGIFRHAPVVFCGISEGSIDEKSLPANVTGNYKGISINDSIDNILKINPSVREIVFIIGVARQDDDYRAMIRKADDEYKGRVKITVMQDYSLEKMAALTSSMDAADTAAIYLAVHQDKTGKMFSPQEALSVITKSASIPVYGVADAALECGIVGGNLYGFKDLSYHAAMIGLDVLDGKKPSDISVGISKNLNYFDWAALRKWKIKRSDLPAGSIIVNEPPNPWTLYGTQIVLALTMFIVAFFLIVALVIQLRLKQKTGKKLFRLNRELLTISECNQSMLRAENETALLSEICKIICEKGGYRMAWVGYAEQDELRTVRPVCWGGFENGYLSDIDIRWSDTIEGKGPTGTSIRTKESCYIQDIEKNPDVVPWQKKALVRGYRSCIALALVDVNKTAFGALTILASKPNAFDREEISLLEGLSGDLSYGVNFLHYQTEQKKSEEKVRKSLAEKEALLRELYHRTKNNMQVISSMLSMQLSYTPDEKIAGVFTAIRNRIQSMSLVQQKLYLSKDLSSIDLKEYIIDLSKLLADSYKIADDRIGLDMTELESIFVLIDNAIPCGMVINELISNAMKHAFPGERNGKIKITLKRDADGFIEMTVSDDGIGVGDDFSFGNDSKLGLKTMIFIVEKQLNGKMTISRDRGLKFSIMFKDDLYERRV
jgi:two-component sensor histidine kinase/ABC-type uncharacterized transport system substrate-binding protein